jgi:hypothetical protein
MVAKKTNQKGGKSTASHVTTRTPSSKPVTPKKTATPKKTVTPKKTGTSTKSRKACIKPKTTGSIVRGKARHTREPGVDEKVNRLKSQMQTLRQRDRYTVTEAAARWRDLTRRGEDNFCPDTEHNGMARYYLEHGHYKFPRIRNTVHHTQVQPNLALYLLKTFAAADETGLIKVYSIGARGDEYYVTNQDYWLLVDQGVLNIE